MRTNRKFLKTHYSLLSVTWEYWDKEAVMIKWQMYSSGKDIVFDYQICRIKILNIIRCLIGIKYIFYTVFYYNCETDRKNIAFMTVYLSGLLMVNQFFSKQYFSFLLSKLKMLFCYFRNKVENIHYKSMDNAKLWGTANR